MSKLGSSRKYKKALIGYGIDKSIAKDYAKKYRKGEMSDEDMERQISMAQGIAERENPRLIREEVGDR